MNRKERKLCRSNLPAVTIKSNLDRTEIENNEKKRNRKLCRSDLAAVTNRSN